MTVSNDASQFQPLVSVVIKTYDDSADASADQGCGQPEGFLKTCLKETLEVLSSQTLRPYEILVVDSSRGDGIARMLRTLPIAEKLPVRRIVLASDEFSHPRALNLGVGEAKGEIVCSLSGDATPADERWLECLVRPLADRRVAGAYSRQIGRPGLRQSGMEWLRLWWRYRKRAVLKRGDRLFSNASSAFHRDLALETPFDENLVELEDYDWAIRVRKSGYEIVYAGNSEVYHSHDRSSWQTFRRMIYYAYLRAKLRVAHSRVFGWFRGVIGGSR